MEAIPTTKATFQNRSKTGISLYHETEEAMVIGFEA